jgi:serine/threonine protein kinase
MANVTWQVLDGLEYLHCEMHVIHRDIKPSNLLLSSSGVVKITDFGVSGELEERLGESTGKVTWVGTIYYMSPERAQGHVYKYDSDMWSLGLTLIECLCGRFPYLQSESSYKQLSFWELMRRIVEQDAPRLPATGYGDQVQDFIQQVLQKEPRNRGGAAMMKAHAWFNDAAKQAELAAWIEQSGVVGEPQVAASPSASTSDECRRVVFSPSPAKSRSSRTGQFLGELDFVNVSPADSTPMNTSLRGGANPFMPCLANSDCSQALTPSDRRERTENPFAQFAPGSEGSVERATSSRLFLPKGSGSETPMNRSMRGGENPFLRGTPSPFPEAQSPSSLCGGTPQCHRGQGLTVEASPMSQSLRSGGDNPFLQRISKADASIVSHQPVQQ